MPMHHPTPERRSCGTTRLALGMFALWGALMLAGCIPQYKLIPPGDPAGIQCVSHCNQIQADCRNRAMEQAEQGRAQCERDAEIDYLACLAYSKGEDRKNCSRKSCYVSPNTYACNGAYHGCFESCGGTVIQVN